MSSSRFRVAIAEVKVYGVAETWRSGRLWCPALYFEHLVDGLAEALEVVVDEPLLVEVLIPEYADKGKKPIDLLQV